MNEVHDKGYSCFLMFISGVSLIFSLVALLRWDNWDVEVSSTGIVIATLSVLLTFVVAWQIWQVIDAKETIRKIREDTDKENKKREADLKKCTEQLSVFTFAANCVNDALMMMTELHGIINNGFSSARNQTGYNIAYKTLLGAIRDVLKANTLKTEIMIDMCLDNMDTCITKAEKLKDKYEKYASFDSNLDKQCNKYFQEITNDYSELLSHSQHAKLAEINKRQKALVRDIS